MAVFQLNDTKIGPKESSFEEPGTRSPPAILLVIVVSYREKSKEANSHIHKSNRCPKGSKTSREPTSSQKILAGPVYLSDIIASPTQLMINQRIQEEPNAN